MACPSGSPIIRSGASMIISSPEQMKSGIAIRTIRTNPRILCKSPVSVVPNILTRSPDCMNVDSQALIIIPSKIYFNK